MPITELAELDPRAVADCLGRYGAILVSVPPLEAIPGSFWGEPEAGLEGRNVYARADTPVHSLLHELGHFVCMTADRRSRLRKNAGGDADEECAVCYLQVLLADFFPSFGRRKALCDMAVWGYSFREGSADAWWRGDAKFARAWLIEHGLIDAQERVTWRVRE